MRQNRGSKIATVQCGVYKIFVSLENHFVKSILQWNSLLKDFFRKTVIQKFRKLHTLRSVEKSKKLLSSNNFSSIQLFSNLFSKIVIYTKFLPKMRESKWNHWFTVTHCGRIVQWNEITLKNFREINSLVTSLTKTLIRRKKCWSFRKNRDRVL